MATTAADIQALPSGEFAAVADATLNIYIARAEARVSTDWGTMRDTAVLYLAAHLYALDKQGTNAASGPLMSIGAGPIHRAYATTREGSRGYDATHWGRQFAQMMTEHHFGPVAL
jgi:hypothetical protein